MAKQTATSASKTIGPWHVRDGKASLFIKGTGGTRDWDGALAQVEFLPPWSDPDDDWVADAQYQYTADAFEVIEAGDAIQARIVFSGDAGALEVDAEITS